MLAVSVTFLVGNGNGNVAMRQGSWEAGKLGSWEAIAPTSSCGDGVLTSSVFYFKRAHLQLSKPHLGVGTRLLMHPIDESSTGSIDDPLDLALVDLLGADGPANSDTRSNYSVVVARLAAVRSKDRRIPVDLQGSNFPIAKWHLHITDLTTKSLGKKISFILLIVN